MASHANIENLAAICKYMILPGALSSSDLQSLGTTAGTYISDHEVLGVRTCTYNCTSTLLLVIMIIKMVIVQCWYDEYKSQVSQRRRRGIKSTV